MYVHRSNRAEELVRVLADVVATPSGDPFARECIVVQGRGMERWLSLELARRHGVWANPDFPFPRHLILRALDAVLGPRAAGRRRLRAGDAAVGGGAPAAGTGRGPGVRADPALPGRR